MSLYGALFGGVSGLNAQSSKIGAISDNIANVNTIGYKEAEATFSSLVINTSQTAAYQTGGVRAGTRLDIAQQGLLQTSNSSTDLAISGGGFFVVRSVADGSVGGTAATPLYTRAGSFTPDALGNFINTQGFYLQGWPLDRDGRLPGEPGNANTTSLTNFDSLKPVNVETASGVAQGTSTISIGANLKAGEKTFAGAAGIAKNDANNTANASLPQDSIYVSSEYGLATADSVQRGDQFSISTGAGTTSTYQYGGYTIGRQITTVGGASNYGDGSTDNTAVSSIASATAVQFGPTSTSFTLNVPTSGLISGDKITLAGFTGTIGTGPGTPAAELNGQHTVTVTGPNTVIISVTTAHTATTGNAGPNVGATADTRVYAGNIFDAATPSQSFFGQVGTSGFSSSALKFTITTADAGTQTFSYVGSSPSSTKGEFNSLASLATAIDTVAGLSARVVDGRLVVGAEDASKAVTFANGDAAGSTTAPATRGIDWVGELGLKDISVATGAPRFSSLAGLSKIVNTTPGLTGTVTNPLSDSSLSINVNNPLDTIQFKDPINMGFSVTTAGTPIGIAAGGSVAAGSAISVTITDAVPTQLAVGDSVYLSGFNNGTAGFPGQQPNGGPYTVTAIAAGSYTVSIPVATAATIATGNFAAPATNKISDAGSSIVAKSNQGDLLAHFGITSSLHNTVYATAGDTGLLGPKYDPTDPTKNMASGAITAQFSRNVRIYDSLGSGHDVRFSFIKTGDNTWAAEVHVIPATDVSTPNGQIAAGTIQFNGDGSLRSVSTALQSPLTIAWNNQALPSTVSLDLGTAGFPFGTTGTGTVGLSDGLSQFDSAYNVNFANQNGAPVGQLVSVAIDKDGIVSASYSNGQIQALFKIPLASFANPDGLDALSGNTFTQTQGSGEVNLREAGNNGTGTVVASALEASNVDLATELTDIIVAQRSYQANTKVIKTADDLLNELNQI